MTNAQVTPGHLTRQAAIYVRQSTVEQVSHNLESQRRQYGLVDRAVALGWSRPQVVVIDDDLGVSGGGVARVGFERLVAEVGLGHVGIVLAIEVSRLARNNRDWYHLLDLCAMVDTLIADGDGLYHPGVFNDRLLLGLKGWRFFMRIFVIRYRSVRLDRLRCRSRAHSRGPSGRGPGSLGRRGRCSQRSRGRCASWHAR